MQFDFILRNALVVDGTGEPPVRADVAICDNRIAALGQLDSAAARREIDATGFVVAPGFIDIHTHAVHFDGKVNGTLVKDAGRHTGALAGEVLVR